jgi:hypothetical protein
MKMNKYTETICPAHNIRAYFDETLKMIICPRCREKILAHFVRQQHKKQGKNGVAHGSEIQKRDH